MKKLLSILVLSLLFGGSALAEIYELNKCIIMDEGRAKHTKAKWSNNFYEENNTIYYLYLKEPKKIFDDRFQIRAEVYLSDIKDEVA